MYRFGWFVCVVVVGEVNCDCMILFVLVKLFRVVVCYKEVFGYFG